MSYELVVTFKGNDPQNTITAHCDSIVMDGDIMDLLVDGVVAWTVKCWRIISIRTERKQ